MVLRCRHLIRNNHFPDTENGGNIILTKNTAFFCRRNHYISSRNVDLTHGCVLLTHHQKYLILHTQIYGLLQIEIPISIRE
jgi:hypothetical protein